MRGFVFTLDVLIGLSLLMGIIFLMPIPTPILPERVYERLSFVADDAMNVLSTLTTLEVSDLPTISSLVTKGILTSVDMNKTLLDLVASFWYAGNRSTATTIAQEILEPITGDVQYFPDAHTAGLWHLNEGNGTIAYDSSDRLNNGTLIGNSTGPSWVDGRVCSGLLFDRFIEYVAIPVPHESSLDIKDSFTLEAWVLPFRLEGTRTILERHYNYALWIRDGFAYFGVFDLVYGWLSVNSSGTLPLDEWTHVAGSYDHANGILKLYIRGKLDSIAHKKIAYWVDLNNYDLRMGNGYMVGDLASQFYGRIDEVRISLVPRQGFKSAYYPRSQYLSLGIDNETIYHFSCGEVPQNVATASRIETGYELGKPVFGYLARAWALKIGNRTTQKVVDFNPEGSSYRRGRPLKITKYFELPTEIEILDGVLYVSMHYGSSKAEAEFISLRVNGVQKKADVVWLYIKQLPGLPILGTAAFGVVDVTNELLRGENEIEVIIGTPELYHSHLHPGMRVIATYRTNATEWVYNRTVRRRLYFDDVMGIEGVWAIFPFFIEPGATDVNVTLHLAANDIEDLPPQWVEWEWHQDVEIYLNTEDPIFVDANPPEDPTYVLTNLHEYLKNGTNVFSIYLNCYGDVAWGKEVNRIYSDPFDDPEDSSYVEVEYNLEVPPALGYLQVDLTREVEYGSEPSNPKETNFSTPRPIVRIFNHLATGFSSMVEVFAKGDEWAEVYESANVREVPTTIYIPPEEFVVGTNFVRVRDFQPDGSTSPYNEILPWSSIEYTILIPAAVGYGDVFANRTQAIEDAKQRVLNLLASYGIELEAKDVRIQDRTTAGIRWLWGPSLIKLSVWR
jgi:hypothetical protein